MSSPEGSSLISVEVGDCWTAPSDSPDEVGFLGDSADCSFGYDIFFAVRFSINDVNCLDCGVSVTADAPDEGESAAEQFNDASTDGRRSDIVAAVGVDCVGAGGQDSEHC